MKRQAKIVAQGIFMAGVFAALTGCEFTVNSYGQFWIVIITIIGILAGVALLAFIAYGIVAAFYKGKVYSVRVIKKEEPKVLRGGVMGRSLPGYKGNAPATRRERRQKGRLRYSKITVEFVGDEKLDGEKKVLRCNDFVLFDKLIVGKLQKVRIRFNEIVKIMK